MPLYEHVFMARQDVSSQQVDTLTEQFKSIVEENGGSVGKTEYWGLRNLAYRVKKHRKGHYGLLDIDAPADLVSELERRQRLSDDVIRHMTVKVEEHSDEQSAILSKKDDRRRRERR